VPDQTLINAGNFNVEHRINSL